jgi:hypothetical protein
MSDRLWQRLGAASGIVYAVTLLGPDLIQGGPSEEPTTAAAAIAQSCARTTAAQPADAVIPILSILGFLCFLFFLGSLWSVLRRAEGANGWLAAAAFGGGLMSLTIKLAGGAPVLAALHGACAGIDPQLWQTLHAMDGASFFISFFPLVVLLVAFAIVTIRFGALPRWLGWMAVVVAVALLAGGTAGTIYARDDAGLPFLLFVLWTLITSVILVWRAGQPFPAVSGTPVSLPPAVS